MHARRPMLVSEAEFLALPATAERVELLDGEVNVTPAPSVRHQFIVGRLFRALAAWGDAQPSPVFVGLSPQDVRFGPDRILQPDVFLILDRVDLDQRGPLARVPELCVEVLSVDRVYDRVTKRMIYAAAGVREYWCVEPSGLVERWTGEGLSQAEVVEQVLRTSLLPGLELDVPSLFG